MAETDELSIASKLCLACGLCCDGTVFGFALIEESEVEDTAAIGLQTFRTTYDEPAFRLGCHYLDGTACTRYQSWRPSVCGDYYCQVQKRVRKHELAEEKAFSMIARARQMTDEIKALLPPECQSRKRGGSSRISLQSSPILRPMKPPSWSRCSCWNAFSTASSEEPKVHIFAARNSGRRPSMALPRKVELAADSCRKLSRLCD
ncbi:YkgJ family cysteine cluster protein [Novosphingobium sp. THN1]|uniref:YkgJ family cysteine cluster protein n=1 Tax=Novosphingobium sp. THN1 TaxID=1016987 RepID=UPI000E46A727|nr:YkgJ family cysteine cluster protein [Novosphingobium sp. THN1]